MAHLEVCHTVEAARACRGLGMPEHIHREVRQLVQGALPDDEQGTLQVDEHVVPSRGKAVQSVGYVGPASRSGFLVTPINNTAVSTMQKYSALSGYVHKTWLGRPNHDKKKNGGKTRPCGSTSRGAAEEVRT